MPAGGVVKLLANGIGVGFTLQAFTQVLVTSFTLPLRQAIVWFKALKLPVICASKVLNLPFEARATSFILPVKICSRSSCFSQQHFNCSWSFATSTRLFPTSVAIGLMKFYNSVLKSLLSEIVWE